jgi:drug/metabolite transporter (DMT)-like permease
MVAAMAGFAIEDAFLKTAAQTVSPGQVMIFFGLGGALVFAALAAMNGQSLIPAGAFGRTMMIRNGFEVIGRMFYTLAVALTPLSATTAILQATPIVVVAGAAVFFGETVGWRRWSAILIGLFGVLVILRPGADSFSSLSILAVLGMLGFAFRDLATRAAPPSMGTFALGVYGFLAIVVAGLIYTAYSGADVSLPSGPARGSLAMAVVFGVIGYAALTRAMRMGEVSAVTPFRYSRLLFGIAFGVLLFGERPDLWTLVGSGIVVLSGLYILARGRRPVG